MSSDIEKWPAPEDPVAFESLCLDLWKEIWKDSGAKKTGRRGQTQDGVDISGCAEGRQMGVQCKKKDGHLRYKLTIAELEKAVTKAKSFSPKLDVLTIATTGPKDAAIEERARILSEEHRAEGLFSVEVWAWEDIWHDLYRRKALLKRIRPIYWPTLASASSEDERLAPIATAVSQLLNQVLISFLLLPKTICRICLSPASIPGYVESELGRTRMPFRDFTPPIAFFVIGAVLPVIALLIPISGHVIKMWAGKNLNLANIVLLSFPKDATDVLLSGLKIFHDVNEAYRWMTLILVLGSWPLAATLVVQVFSPRSLQNRMNSKRHAAGGSSKCASRFSLSALKPTFFTQLYLFGTLFMYHYLIALLYFLWDQWPSMGAQNLLSGPAYCLTYVVVRRQIQRGAIATFGVMLVIFVVGLLFMIVGECITLVPIFFNHFSSRSL